MEAFFGITFSSLCGAVLFAKISRVASFAQVSFSDPIVVRYGEGLVEEVESSDDEGEEKKPPSDVEGFNQSKLHCPVFEFRILNRLYAQHGGEIIDASLNVVASLDESQAAHAVKNAARGTRRRGKKGKRRNLQRSRSKEDGTGSFLIPNRHNVGMGSEHLQSLVRQSKIQKMDEDPSGEFISKKIFAKLDMDSFEHPFFKRVWLVRHVLDHHSPILKQEARELVRLHGGHWPRELNNADGVRASIHFDQILVSLSGTSNVDSNSVYAQNVYDFCDLCVGYRFVNALFRDSDGSIGVDPVVLNDVTAQYGGGAEDLHNRTQRQNKIENMVTL